MRAIEFIKIGTNPRRPAREGARPTRGHNPVERYRKVTADYCDACDRPKSECICDEQQLDELQFLGSECTKDCSGHRAGYQWSKAHGLRQGNSPWSPSFNKGAALAVAGK